MNKLNYTLLLQREWRIDRECDQCFSEGGGLPASTEGGGEEEAGERAAPHPGGAGETAEEEGIRDPHVSVSLIIDFMSEHHVAFLKCRYWIWWKGQSWNIDTTKNKVQKISQIKTDAHSLHPAQFTQSESKSCVWFMREVGSESDEIFNFRHPISFQKSVPSFSLLEASKWKQRPPYPSLNLSLYWLGLHKYNPFNHLLCGRSQFICHYCGTIRNMQNQIMVFMLSSNIELICSLFCLFWSSSFLLLFVFVSLFSLIFVYLVYLIWSCLFLFVSSLLACSGLFSSVLVGSLTWEWRRLQVWSAHWSVSCTRASLENSSSCNPLRCSPSLSQNENPTMGDAADTPVKKKKKRRRNRRRRRRRRKETEELKQEMEKMQHAHKTGIMKIKFRHYLTHVCSSHLHI